MKQYSQQLKYKFGSIAKRSKASNDVYLQGFSVEGTRTVVISAFWCLDGDQENVDLLFRHQDIIEIPFSNPFKPSFDMNGCPRAALDPIDPVGLFRPSVLNFVKQQSWLIASKFQNNSNSVLNIKRTQIALNTVILILMIRQMTCLRLHHAVLAISILIW